VHKYGETKRNLQIPGLRGCQTKLSSAKVWKMVAQLLNNKIVIVSLVINTFKFGTEMQNVLLSQYTIAVVNNAFKTILCLRQQ
jgi:hypothetical protein